MLLGGALPYEFVLLTRSFQSRSESHNWTHLLQQHDSICVPTESDARNMSRFGFMLQIRRSYSNEARSARCDNRSCAIGHIFQRHCSAREFHGAFNPSQACESAQLRFAAIHYTVHALSGTAMRRQLWYELSVTAMNSRVYRFLHEIHTWSDRVR